MPARVSISVDDFIPKSGPASKEVLTRGQDEALTDFFTRLWKAYKDTIAGVVFFRVRDHFIAQDIISIVYLNAFDAFKRGRGATENVRAWLFKIAANAANDYFRRAAVSERVIPFGLDDVEDHTYEGLTNQLPIGRFLDIILVRRALRLLEHWNQRQALVIQRVYFDGYQIWEVAKQLHITHGAVKALQHRALVQLRNILCDVVIDPITA